MIEFVIKVIFFILEIGTNATSLIILPLSDKFKKEYLSTLDELDVDTNISDLESKLSSPRKTCKAILVFGLFLGLCHLIKAGSFVTNLKSDIDNLNGSLIKIDLINVVGLFINWCMAISIIPKLNKVRGDKFNNKLTDGIRLNIIIIICLYSSSYIFIFCQYFLKFICDKLCNCYKKSSQKESTLPNKKETISVKMNIEDKINYSGNNTTSRNYINANNSNLANRKESTQVRTANNHIVLLSNILPPQIYENIKSFIQQGKEKLIELIKFFMDMKFDDLTTENNITNEISGIIIGVGKVLGDDFDDKIAKALLESGSEDHLMLLMHYAFPFIVAVIKLKIEKGIYKRSTDVTQINLIQVLTQIERKIELDEQSNIKLSFRVNRQINESSLSGLLNP